MVVQVGLDSQTAAAQHVLAVLGCAPEARVQLIGAAVGGVSDLSRKVQSRVGAFFLVVVVSASPVGVQFNGSDLRVRPSRTFRVRACCRGHDDQTLTAQREGHSPLERAVSSQGGADDRVPRRNPEVIRQPRLGLNLIAR